ncbi:MAG TPA: permease-like cell division protein FtsX [Gemmatimonadales bacterium]|nr:permease-like cell division protein FtsX [Gemmatimonadales bacterium]
MSSPWREALRTFRRAPLLSALSVASIGFSLFTVGLFGLVALNFRASLRSLAERVEVVAFVLRGTPTEAITAASQDIQAFPEVLEVRYVSEEQALARAREELVEFKEAYRDLETNPLPASLEVQLRPAFRDAVSAQRVAERIRTFGFVDDVRYGRDWVERLDRLRNMAAVVGLVIGLAFAVVAIVIIGVTIRITVLQRAGEIAIMRLVGATNRFIRGPFLLEGALKGVLGGGLAIGMCWATFAVFRNTTGTMGSTLVFFEPQHLALMMVFGTGIGLLGSLLSVGRHLRHV